MTWFSAFIPGGDPEGNPVISVLAKRTYDLAPGKVTVSDQQIPLVESDIPADPANPNYCDILAETDYLVWKPATDVIVVGAAHAPRGKQAYHLDCEVQAGPLRKTVRVYGPRTVESKALRGIAITDPQPFSEMPLGYAHAYGGTAVSKEGTLFSYYPNPIGVGFALKGGFDDPAQLKVPSLEDPESPVTADSLVLPKFEAWADAPKPASLGWTRRNFYPRYTYAGVLPEYLEAAMKNVDDAKQKDSRFADYQVPRMDFRVYQGASDGLWGKPLNGDENVSLTYLDPENPRFQFVLPGEKPVMSLDIGEGAKELVPVLHTVVIDMKEKKLCMTWRGSLSYGGLEQLAQLSKLEVKVE